MRFGMWNHGFTESDTLPFAQPRLGIWNLGILESGNLLQFWTTFGSEEVEGSVRLLCLESWNLGILESAPTLAEK